MMDVCILADISSLTAVLNKVYVASLYHFDGGNNDNDIDIKHFENVDVIGFNLKNINIEIKNFDEDLLSGYFEPVILPVIILGNDGIFGLYGIDVCADTYLEMTIFGDDTCFI